MPSTFKTPGVYVQEISKLPPSVAPVATAVPAFVGYTEQSGALQYKPQRITSLLEYENLFGVGVGPRTARVVVVDPGTNSKKVDITSVDIERDYYLYDSVVAYFANGGGPCYIVSTGAYAANDDSGYTKLNYTTALDALRPEDEPTLLLFPDAVNLPAADFADVQKHALLQCAELQDRFCILDIKEKEGQTASEWTTAYETFRTDIGSQNLKYGAAYTPWVQANIPQDIGYYDIEMYYGSYLLANKKTIKTWLTDLTLTNTLVDKLDQVALDMGDLDDLLEDGLGNSKTFLEEFDTATESDTAQYGAKVKKIVQAAEEITKLHAANNLEFTNFLEKKIDAGGVLEGIIRQVKAYTKGWTFATPLDTVVFGATDFDGTNHPSGTFKPDYDLGTVVADATIYEGITTFSGARDNSREAFRNLMIQTVGVIEMLKNACLALVAEMEDQLFAGSVPYAAVISEIRNIGAVLPPSGYVAGIYSTVDRTRGVWKAPANISLNGVLQPTIPINDTRQDLLNVHSSGKSINAIRKFTGKGNLIWGARTLAGNDNEWRYVSVRRLYLFVEESVRKATEFVVFEPNDANTWQRVKGMIENFLTNLWKDGALAGPTPKAAFFVNIGLGETMTAQDILEGKLIVEIGMAAVRPAEFIILRFSHKLQES